MRFDFSEAETVVEMSNNNFVYTIHPPGWETSYLSEKYAEFHFIFNSTDGKCDRIPVHKVFLSAKSNVFEKMFTGSWSDKWEVEIVDVTASAFREFLQFIYLSKVKLTMENVSDVIDLGKKYNMNECVIVCGEFITARTPF